MQVFSGSVFEAFHIAEESPFPDSWMLIWELTPFRKKKTTQIKFVEAIMEALHISMQSVPYVIYYGLGVSDQKVIFGTTMNLQCTYITSRVFDIPTSKNEMTSLAIGNSLNDIKLVMVHQRLDFFLLAMGQLVNATAKWHYMFGNQISVPITIRLILGRGWSHGSTHSQNLQAWYAHIPVLKVVMQRTPESVKSLLLASIFDPNPVVFLKHHWLNNLIVSLLLAIIGMKMAQYLLLV